MKVARRVQACKPNAASTEREEEQIDLIMEATRTKQHCAELGTPALRWPTAAQRASCMFANFVPQRVAPWRAP